MFLFRPWEKARKNFITVAHVRDILLRTVFKMYVSLKTRFWTIILKKKVCRKNRKQIYHSE